MDVFRSALNFVSAKLAKEIVGVLISNGKLDLLKETLAKHINQHTASSELLLWFGRERTEDFVDILGPEVFRAMLTSMERDQFNEKRSNRLRDFILEDQALIVELTSTADIEVVKDLTRALKLSPVFDDMDKRSLLARLVKAHPAVQPLITGEQTKQEAGLLVSWESLERRRLEYQELVEKKIPANSKEIAIARSYGDLRENHEYKAAKEMQKILMRQKEDLEAALNRARGQDFLNAKTEVVGPAPLWWRPTSRPTSARPSPSSARGIPIPTPASSATSRPSRWRWSTARSATRWNLNCTAANAATASRRSRRGKRKRPASRRNADK